MKRLFLAVVASIMMVSHSFAANNEVKNLKMESEKVKEAALKEANKNEGEAAKKLYEQLNEGNARSKTDMAQLKKVISSDKLLETIALFAAVKTSGDPVSKKISAQLAYLLKLMETDKITDTSAVAGLFGSAKIAIEEGNEDMKQKVLNQIKTFSMSKYRNKISNDDDLSMLAFYESVYSAGKQSFNSKEDLLASFGTDKDGKDTEQKRKFLEDFEKWKRDCKI